MSDNNALFSVTMGTLAGITKSSDAAKLTVFPDTFPPLVVNAGGLQSTNGTTFDVGVTFDEPADTVTANDPTKYKVTPGGTVTAARYLGGSPGTLLTVSGLVVGNSYTVTVEGVKDLKGNTMPATPKPFKVSAMKWGETGGNEFGQKVQVIPVGVNGWDVYSDGMTAWAAYDESVTVYEAITGDFDKVVRVEYQDNSSQWARAGVIAKDVLNFGVNRAAQTGGAACRYQKAHISPVKTAMGTAGNNAWEGNRRLTTGAQTTGAGGGGTPEYPHAWARLQRIGQQFKIFRSNDGKAWVDYGTTNFDPPMPATLFVGPDYSPENGNVDQSLRQLWVAKFRDYGDFKASVTPTISLNAQGQIVYEGTLVSSQTVDGTYAPVLGATSPYTMPKTGSGTFYRTQE
jgi:hypothetical protein